MLVRSRCWLAAFAILAMLLTGCAAPLAQGGAKERPATVENAGTNLSRIRLSEQAAKRLGIETTAVREAATGGSARRTIPYAAVLYDPSGATYTYTNPEPLVFVRVSLRIERISGDQAILTDGPPAGVLVVVKGAPELVGIESGIGTSDQ